MPILFCIVLSTAAALVYTAYQTMVDNNKATMAAVKKAENDARREATLHTEFDD